MLAILRTQPTGIVTSSRLDATVTLRDGDQNIEGCPDIQFSMRTYLKIANDKKDVSDNETQVGDSIILPINLFFEELSLKEQKIVYEMYRFTKEILKTITAENRREVEEKIQDKIYNTITNLKLDQKMIDFCKKPIFVYPCLKDIGLAPHHTAEKTYDEYDYIELTAVCILAKMMFPIWGEFISKLSDIDINSHRRETMAFELIEPNLQEGPFERIYNKLSYSLVTAISEIRKAVDSRTIGGTDVSYILTHNFTDDQMFNVMIMAVIIVKRLASYECITVLPNGNTPDVMVYIYDNIKKSADSRIKMLRKEVATMPRKPQPQHTEDDNSSIIDYVSRTSSKPIDDPIFVNVAVREWELPRLLKDTNTPMDVFTSAIRYYESNYFDANPLAQALIASFVGTRFGGSRCIGYLQADLYKQLITILQIFLIRNDMTQLAALLSARTSAEPFDGPLSSVGTRISLNLMKLSEYIRCQSLIKGFIEKPISQYGRRGGKQKSTDFETIDFVHVINRLKDWVIRYTHSENMAPSLWEFAKYENRPITGSDCHYDENIMRDVCRFFLIFLDDEKPF